MADWLGGKTTIIVDLPIAPMAAYLLAAGSTPEAAREAALERAKAGEEVTHALAKEIVEQARARNGEKRRGRPSHRVLAQLTRTLVECQDNCPEDSRSEVARQLREAADALEGRRQEAL